MGRHERFRESDALRWGLEGAVAMCVAAGFVGGEAFSVDASLIKANVDKMKRVSGDYQIAWPTISHTVREYLAPAIIKRGHQSHLKRLVALIFLRFETKPDGATEHQTDR